MGNTRNRERRARRFVLVMSLLLCLPLSSRLHALEIEPAFQEFEGKVRSVAVKEDKFVQIELSTSQGGQSVMISGGNPTLKLDKCEGCTMISRVPYSPEGPSQIVTILREGRPLVVWGINTDSSFPLFYEPSIAAAAAKRAVSISEVLRGAGEANARSSKPSGGLAFEARALERAAKMKSELPVNALDDQWTLKILSSRVSSTNDVAGKDKDLSSLKVDWVLASARPN